MRFSKYHGAGNDFILVDDREEVFPIQEAARWCHRRFGIGADGLVLLQNSRIANFRMRIFNADGSEATMCGNALRCLIAFLRDRQIAAGPISIEIGNKVARCFCEGEKISVELKGCRIVQEKIWADPYEVELVDTGAAHAVVFAAPPKDFISAGRFLRSHPLFAPEGVNVNFAVFEGGVIKNRTYERGVEGETLACGSGAMAVAIIAAKRYDIAGPITIVPASGEQLEVEINQDRVVMTGPATFVFEGAFA